MGIYYQFVNKSPTGFAMGNHISVVINYQFINKYIAHRQLAGAYPPATTPNHKNE